MSSGTFRLSPWQLAVLVFTLSLCVTPFGFPGVIDGLLGRQGWLTALPGIAVGLWGTLAAAGIARRFPGRPFDRIALDLLGPVPGVGYLVALVLLFFGGAAGNLQIFAGVAAATQLTNLPPAYPAVLTGAVGALAAYFGPEVVARTAEAMAPFVGVGLLAIVVPLVGEAHLGRLLPVGGLPWDRFLNFNVLPVAGTIRGFLALLVLGPFCRPRPRTGPLCAATVAAGTLVAASLALPVALFGEGFTAQLRYPFLTAVGTLTWQWLPVHHLVVLSMLVWHAIALVVFAAYLWLGAWLLGRICPHLPWVVSLLGLAAAETAAASLQLPDHLSHGFVVLWNDAVVVLGLLVPTLLWVLARRQPAEDSGRVTR